MDQVIASLDLTFMLGPTEINYNVVQFINFTDISKLL